MAIKNDSSAVGSQIFANSLTYSHTCSGKDRILFVTVKFFTNDYVTGVTYGGSSMTLVDKQLGWSGGHRHYLYYLINPNTGANNVVVSASGTDYLSSVSSSYTGVSQTGQPNVYTKNTVTGNELTTTLTTTKNGCWTLIANNNNSGVILGATGTVYINGTLAGIGILDSGLGVYPEGSTSLGVSGAYTHEANIMVAFSPSSTKTNGEYLGAGAGTTQALYHFNDDMGDASGNGLYCTLACGTVAYAGGKFGKAFSFDGSTMIKTADCTVLSGTSMTMALWVKSSSDGVYLISRDGYSNPPYSAFYTGIGINSLSNKFVIAPLTGVTGYASTTSINDNVWHLVGFSYDGANIKIYVDGVLETTQAYTTAFYNNSRPLFLGGRTNNLAGTVTYLPITGLMDEAILEGTPRSPERWKKYYTMTKGRFGIL